MNWLLHFIGYGVAFGIVCLMWQRNAWRWNRLANAYASGVEAPVIAERKLQQLILTGAGLAYNSYKGIVTVGVCKDGLSLSLLPPFSIFHPQLVIPFEDLQVAPTTWYLNCTSYKLSTARAPGIEIVIDEGLQAWIAANCSERAGNAVVEH